MELMPDDRSIIVEGKLNSTSMFNCSYNMHTFTTYFALLARDPINVAFHDLIFFAL